MNEIIVEFEKNSNEPLYIQLYKHIREEIKSNRLKKGKKLPSIRYLANFLGISKITINNAYQQLLVEGYIESRERSGMYVLEVEKSLLPPVDNSGSTISKPSSISPIAYDFKYGHIDASNFNFNLWRKLTSQVLQSANEELLQFGDPQGELKLREEIAKYLRTSRGVLCNAEQIIITSSTENSLQLVCELCDHDTKSVAVEDPCWLCARYIFKKNHFKITSIPLDKDGICLKSLENSYSKLIYITPSHQFPSGIVMPITRRQNLLKWAKNTEGFIIEDDYDSEFRYTGRPIPSLQGLDDDERVIYLGSFSKSLAPSLRISYMVLPDKFLTKYKHNISIYTQTTSRMNQKILQMFMTNGHWDQHIRKMRRIYGKKYNTLIKAVENNLNNKVRLIGGKAGLHVLLEITNGMDEDTIINKGRAVGVQICSASKYWANTNSLKHPVILIGFGGLSENEIIEGIKLLGHVLSNH